jgi:hypothetical protein
LKLPRAETLVVALADALARPAPRVGMSNLPDGPLRRMWAEAGVIEAPIADAKPEPASEACLPPHGESPAVGAENVDPEGSDASGSSDAEAGAAYERERDARIARNRERMRHLGIDTLSVRVGAVGDGKKPAPARASVRRVAKGKRARVETVATRRSTRATSGCRAPISFLDDVSEEALRALGETAAARRARLALETTAARDAGRAPRETLNAQLEDVFEDSSVLRYACRREGMRDVRGSDGREGATTDVSASASVGRAPRPNERLRGFEEDPGVVFVDPAMKKGFYSLHTATRGGTSALAAGGDGGRVALFALDDQGTHGGADAKRTEESEEEDSSPLEDDDEEKKTRAAVSLPLQSWVAHRGWCGQVQFAPPSLARADFRVLSAGGMDGTVALWDTSRVGRESGRPLELFRDDRAHDGGIFSMHWSRGAGVLTSSKDGTTCVSRLADDASSASSTGGAGATKGPFVVERRIDNAHSGVVKCARWRANPTLGDGGDGGDDTLFATCGNDGRVCVLDARAARAAAQTLEAAHGGRAVNFLEWAATASGPGVGSVEAENVFCTSATGDHAVLVWDLRYLRSRTPLLSLAGHIPRSVARPKALYRPAFIGAGGGAGAGELMVVTPGERSNAASLYAASDGATIRKVDASERSASPAKRLCEAPLRRSPLSRGDVGFDATATCVLAARDGGGVGAGGWTLAMANRGEVRVYRSKWGTSRDVTDFVSFDSDA